jgi:dolichyl-phosphate-mannose--protein O-mannosyl transferase
VTWAGWFATGTGFDRHWADGSGVHSHWHLWKLPLPVIGDLMPKSFRSWVHYQHDIYYFHDHLHPTKQMPKYSLHPYQSHPLGWLALERPVSYFYATPGGKPQEVLAIGTPAIWWASIPALGAMVWFWIAKRDWRAAAALLGVAIAVLGWIPSDLHQRTMFLFYALPAVPFMVIALTLCIGYAIGSPDSPPLRQTIGASAAGSYLLLVVINFFYLYPILAAQAISLSAWHNRIWFPSWI